MVNKDDSHNQQNLDIKILSDFIIEMNIFLHLVASYPENHPVISNSIEKVLRILGNLPETREEITIGVTRDTLMAGHEVLNTKNPVYRNLAKVLFDRDIAAITFKKIPRRMNCCVSANLCSADGKISGNAAGSRWWLRNPACPV